MENNNSFSVYIIPCTFIFLEEYVSRIGASAQSHIPQKKRKHRAHIVHISSLSQAEIFFLNKQKRAKMALDSKSSIERRDALQDWISNDEVN